jgi:Amidase
MIQAIAAAHAIGRKMAAFLTSYDVILSTTLAGPPPKLGYFDQNGDVQTFTDRVTEYLSVTPLHNATGTPAMSVPLHWSSDDQPISVHWPLWRRSDLAVACRAAGDRATLVRPRSGSLRNRGNAPGVDLVFGDGLGRRQPA